MLSALLTLITLAALLYTHTRLWTWLYRRDRWPDERHFIQAADGWRLALHRLRPRGEAPRVECNREAIAGRGEGEPEGFVRTGRAAPRAMPVICCPGLACNSRFFDASEALDDGLARRLAAEGFDVWMLDPRGTGHSARAGLDPRRWRYGFEEYAALDAPAAVAYVLSQTGRKPWWVGHSMGGLIGYRVALAEGLPGVVGIGSPVVASPQRLSLGALSDVLMRRRPPLLVPVGLLGRLALPLAGRLWRPWPEALFVHLARTPGAVTRRFLAEVCEDIPSQLLDQFADNILEINSPVGAPLRASLAALAAYEGPVLTLAGAADRIAPPASVEGPSPHAARTHVEVDAGHLDLVLGDHGVTDQVVAWLRARVAEASAP